MSPLFKSLTTLSGCVVCALLPAIGFAQSSQGPQFDSFSYASDPLFTPRLVRSKIELPTRPAVTKPVVAPVMSARDERDLRLAIEKATAEILKLTVDYTQLLKTVETLRAEIEADKSDWSVFSGDPNKKLNTANTGQVDQLDSVAANEQALQKSRKQVAVLEKQLASIQERLNAAQANFEGETEARILAVQRLSELRKQLAEAKPATAQLASMQDLETQLQQRDARIAKLEADLASSRAKLESAPVRLSASDSVGVANSASASISDPALAVPVHEWIIAGLEFELGSAEIRKGTESNLDALLAHMQQNPKTQIQVDGYTDSIGTREDNLKLSADRAQAVADYLIQRGIDANRIRVVGYGERRPIATNMYKAGRAQNRRVAIIFFDAPE